MKIIGFFEESPGILSATRLIFIIGMIWLMLICSVALLMKVATFLEIAGAFGIIAGVLEGAKLIQKGQENKDLKS